MYDCMHISYATNIQKVEKSKKQSMTGTMIRRIWLQNKWQVATNGEARKYTVHALWWFTSLKGEFLAISTGARRLNWTLAELYNVCTKLHWFDLLSWDLYQHTYILLSKHCVHCSVGRGRGSKLVKAMVFASTLHQRVKVSTNEEDPIINIFLVTHKLFIDELMIRQ